MKFLKVFKNKRTKLILGIIAAVLVIGSGAIFALAKTGKIDIRSFADEVIRVVTKSPPLVTTKSLSGNVNIYVKSNNTGSASFVGQNTIVDIYYSNAWYSSAYTDTNSDAVFQLPATGPYYAIVRGSNCPTVPFYAPSNFYVYAYCQAIPAGNFTVKGVVKDQASGLPIDGITVQAAPGSDKSFATTASDGSYTLNITPITYTSSASYHLYFSDYSKTRPILYQYDNKTLDKFIGNISNIPTGSPYTATTPEYMYLSTGDGLSLAGTVYGPKTDGTSGDQLVAGAIVQIVNTTSGTVITTAAPSSSSTSADGTRYEYPYNYKTPTFSFNSTDITSLAIKITAPGYTDFGPIPLKNADIIYPATNGTLTLGQLNLLKEYDMTAAAPPATFDLIGLVTGSDTKAALTGATITANCPSSVSAANCQLPPINPVVSISPPTNTHGVTTALNYGLYNLYNIKQPGSKIPSFTITIAKDGYTSKNLTINTTDIKTDTTGKLYAVEGAELVKITPITLLGQVVAAENNNTGVPATVYIYNNDEPNALIAHRVSDTNGYYTFGNLTTSITAGKNYRLVATPTATDRSSEILTITFIAGPNVKNIILAKNNGKQSTVFQGNVSRISNGNKTSIVGAKVFLVNQRDNSTIYHLVEADILTKPKLTNASGNYSLTAKDLVNGDGWPSGLTSVRLIATTVTSPLFQTSQIKSKVYNFSDVRGGLIIQDFVFGASDANIIAASTKTVTLNFKGMLRKYLDRTSGSTAPGTTDVDQSTFPITTVKLACERVASADGGSSFIDYTDVQSISSTGVLIFTNVPKSKCQAIISPSNPNWKVSGDTAITIDAIKAGFTIWSEDWDPTALVNAQKAIMQQQELEDPNKTPVVGYEDGHTVYSHGCCLTAISMAIRFYYPGKTYSFTPTTISPPTTFAYNGQMSPLLLADISNANNGKFKNLSDSPALLANLRSLSGIALTSTKIDPSQIITYLQAGIPVVVYSKNQKYRSDNHCILLVGYSKGNYQIIDPNSNRFGADGSPGAPPGGIHSPYQNYTQAELGDIDTVFAIQSNNAEAYFKTVQTNGTNSLPQNKLTGTVPIPTGATTDWHENINTTAFAGVCDTSQANINAKRSWCNLDKTAKESTANMQECLTCGDNVDNCIGFGEVYTGCNRPTDFYAAVPYSAISAVCGGKANNCPRIEVQYNGKSVILPVVDAGPGVGASGTGSSNYVLNNGSPTYSAGLDISPAAMQVLGAGSGKIMRWRFVTGSTSGVAINNNQGSARGVLADSLIGSILNPVQPAQAADGRITVAPASTVTISTTIKNVVAIPIQNVFVSFSSTNGNKAALKMAKQTDGSYKLTIPKDLVAADFNYNILAYSDYKVQFSSTFVAVHVTAPSSAQSVGIKVLSVVNQVPQKYQDVKNSINNLLVQLRSLL